MVSEFAIPFPLHMLKSAIVSSILPAASSYCGHDCRSKSTTVFGLEIRFIGFNIICETIFFFYEKRKLCLCFINQNPLKIVCVNKA